jgi:hydroxymethylpyrimidine/phosphomethylpyrimidine kinase
MSADFNHPPVVMVFAGLDPSGAAGIQADIEAIASLGAHAAPLITALTIQDTAQFLRLEPVDPAFLWGQARLILDDIPIAGFKIGLIGSAAVAEVIQAVLDDHADLPVVLDPVLAAGSGTPTADDATLNAIKGLLPRVTLCTPNSPELWRFTDQPKSSLASAAQRLIELGAKHVLLTGTHEATDQVRNVLYGPEGLIQAWQWGRLPGEYHGSGCTLAAACAALLARGVPLLEAVEEAQTYTWEALQNGYRIGRGQQHPNRFFWKPKALLGD